jgi:hypothetical protein
MSKLKINTFYIIFGGIVLILIFFIGFVFLNFEFSEARNIFELTSYIVILFGVPIGLLQFYRAKRKEERDREYGTYNALDAEYRDFQKLCFHYPYLDIFDIPDRKPQELNERQKKEELIAYTLLYKIFERAYLMYQDQSSEIRKKQWVGWNAYIRDYLQRPNFQKHLTNLIGQYDEDFDRYIVKNLKELNVKFELGDWAKYLEE